MHLHFEKFGSWNEKFLHENLQQDKMAAMWNKRAIHYREGEGEKICLLKITRRNSGKPKAVIRQSHYSLSLNTICVTVCVCERVCVVSLQLDEIFAGGGLNLEKCAKVHAHPFSMSHPEKASYVLCEEVTRMHAHTEPDVTEGGETLKSITLFYLFKIYKRGREMSSLLYTLEA